MGISPIYTPEKTLKRLHRKVVIFHPFISDDALLGWLNSWVNICRILLFLCLLTFGVWAKQQFCYNSACSFLGLSFYWKGIWPAANNNKTRNSSFSVVISVSCPGHLPRQQGATCLIAPTQTNNGKEAGSRTGKLVALYNSQWTNPHPVNSGCLFYLFLKLPIWLFGLIAVCSEIKD